MKEKREVDEREERERERGLISCRVVSIEPLPRGLYMFVSRPV